MRVLFVCLLFKDKDAKKDRAVKIDFLPAYLLLFLDISHCT